MIKAVLISLAIGGVITSYVEYRLGYNLYDLLKDKLLTLAGSLQGEG